MKNKVIILISFLLLNLPAVLYAGNIDVKQSVWNGHVRYDFTFDGSHATIVCPDSVISGKPWIWRPAFLGAFPSVDKALLKKGFHVVFYDMTHRYGSPQAVEQGRKFYDYLLSAWHFSPKVTLEGFSRGGYYALNWAIANPDKVACLYLDNPVCDMFSWPGEKSKLWNDFLKEWGMTSVDKDNFKGNPLDNLASLASQQVPVIAVCGDSDRVVPFRDNMKLIRDRYQQLGAPVELIIKPGADHHPHSLENPEPVVDFICRNQPDYQEKQYLNERGTLKNSFIRFEKERKGRVAFLGGSITEMRGWRELTKDYLRRRFPFTEFEFIDAGISSTGTTPHSYRFEQDVLRHGDIDLLFVEAAVNDHVNYFCAIDQVRGMEGIVRHALLANPSTDIVMLHFIHTHFLEMYPKGRVPDVILNHERVANYYLIPSVHLAHEVSDRIAAGEFDWEQFGGIHPAEPGHKIYAASLAHLLDKMWSRVSVSDAVEAHSVPEPPLDVNSYYNASFADISQVKLSKGWEHIASWKPDNGAHTRKGFVNVPMLYSNTINSTFSFSFKGRAVGLFCVCGPFSGTLEYSVDNAPYKKLDTYTEWSKNLYIPWAYVLEAELDPEREHKLTVRISKEKNKNSKGHECVIRNILINQ